jgi:ABC-type uncharacterized transport system involved in gliding motility auxiliary subunit
MTGTAALLAGLGVVAIGFGLLSALLALLQPFTDPLWIFGNLVAGAALLGAAIFMSLDTLRERMRSGGSRRAGQYGTSAVVGTVLGIVILGFLGFLSTRYQHRFDVSEAGVHTLSPQTIGLLDGLEQDVSIKAFFREMETSDISMLLERYAFASDRVEVEYLDPNEEPVLVEELGLTADELSRGVLHISLASGESTAISEFSSSQFEPEVTAALFKLLKSTGKKVYFLTGHNERVIEPAPGEETAFASGADSMGRAASALVNETYAVEPLLLASLPDVPADASALIIAGPTRPLLPNELESIERYVAGGGALLVAIDPRAQTNLYALLEDWGIKLGDDVIVDRALAVFGQATTPIAQEYAADHPITSPLREPAIFPMVRSVELDPEVASGFTVLASTGRDSWAERDLEGWRSSGRAEYGEEDLLGPVPVAVAGSPADETGAEAGSEPSAEAGGGRVVVFGDSDFATNEYFDALRNRDLFLNAVNWLAGEVAGITVRPNISRASSFQMSQDEFRRIQFLTLFLLPEAIAVVGVLTWWLRRKAPGAA